MFIVSALSLLGCEAPRAPKYLPLSSLSVTRGTVIVMKGSRALWLATADNLLASIQLYRQELEGSQTRTYFAMQFVDPRQVAQEGKYADPPSSTPGWSQEEAVALALKLSGEKIFANERSCRMVDFMRYIIYGKVKIYGYNLSCPLWRDLRGLSVEDIQSPDFYLLSGRKNGRILVDSLPPDNVAGLRKSPSPPRTLNLFPISSYRPNDDAQRRSQSPPQTLNLFPLSPANPDGTGPSSNWRF